MTQTRIWTQVLPLSEQVLTIQLRRRTNHYKCDNKSQTATAWSGHTFTMLYLATIKMAMLGMIRGKRPPGFYGDDGTTTWMNWCCWGNSQGWGTKNKLQQVNRQPHPIHQPTWRWGEINYTNIECHREQWWDIVHCGTYHILPEAENYSRNPKIAPRSKI